MELTVECTLEARDRCEIVFKSDISCQLECFGCIAVCVIGYLLCGFDESLRGIDLDCTCRILGIVRLCR